MGLTISRTIAMTYDDALAATREDAMLGPAGRALESVATDARLRLTAALDSLTARGEEA
jgi:hypothetical protein